MRIHVSQIYIRPGVSFEFSSRFQVWLGEHITSLARPSPEFLATYGDGFSLIFRMSAKRQILQNEIKGPTVFRKSRNVEFTIFLPFDAIDHEHWCVGALKHLLSGIVEILRSLKVDATQISNRSPAIVRQVCAEPDMFRVPRR